MQIEIVKPNKKKLNNFTAQCQKDVFSFLLRHHKYFQLIAITPTVLR